MGVKKTARVGRGKVAHWFVGLLHDSHNDKQELRKQPQARCKHRLPMHPFCVIKQSSSNPSLA